MSKNLFITSLLIALTGVASAASDATPSLFSVSKQVQRSNADNADIARMASDKTIVSVTPIQLNTSLLAKPTEAMTLSMGGGSKWISRMKKHYALGDSSMVWSGSVDLNDAKSDLEQTSETSDAMFVVRGNRVTGQINIEGNTFEIVTSETGNRHYLVARDFSRTTKRDSNPLMQGPNPFIATPPAADSSILANTIVRVMQVFTPQAVTQLGGRQSATDRANFFIAQSNQTYANNGLSLSLENAGIRFSVTAQPSNSGSTLLSRLLNASDGYLDLTATTVRNQLTADMFVLVTDDNLAGIFGQAAAISANANNAFAVVDQSATNFTFVHELGHLFGARHDNDPTTTPFAFGHGFVNAAANFRTVMGVNANPQPRIGYFSTDDQTLNGSALGNATFADNERVHDVRRTVVAGFR